MIREQFSLLTTEEIFVDLFAGGGGLSTAAELALGRYVDIAVNHSGDALSMHEANHPQTRHLCADIFEVCPLEATQGRPVGHLHGSPDCTHFSQAIGGQPRSRAIRSLGWVMVRWAGQVLPRSISMENVRQMMQWGPLIAKRCKATGRVMKLDGTVAEPGERVPVQEQFLVPDPRHVGRTWRHFIHSLERLGYVVEYRLLNAANYGAATTRERLFLFARRDGRPIVWPEPTHHEKPAKGQRGWRPAADHIDFSDLGQSIFTRKKPLADATLRRIARGMHKFVLNNPEPFIVEMANQSNPLGVRPSSEPLRTITATPKGGSYAVAAPVMVQAAHGDGRPGGVQRWGDGVKSVERPVNTITATGSGGQAVASAYLMQANGGFNETVGRGMHEPSTTITTTGSQQQLVTAFLAHLRGNCDARSADEPLRTISAGGEHHGLMTAHLTTLRQGCDGRELDEPAPTITAASDQLALTQYTLSQEDTEGALRVASFLISYYGTENCSSPGQPMPTATTRDRMALVTVWIKGEPWVIVDIRLRMLTPRELYGCQGFPADYIIDHGHDGRKFSKTAQVRMVGNSVSPPPATALIAANCRDLAAWSKQEIKQRQQLLAA